MADLDSRTRRDRRSRGRRAVRIAGWLGAVVILAAAGATACSWQAFGKRPQGDRRLRLERSAQWRGGHFENPQPMVNDLVGALFGAASASPFTTPDGPLPVVQVDPARLLVPPASGLRITWFGHSTFLVEVEGQRVLVDPLWSERAGPLSWIGPQRWYAPPLPLAALPRPDAVVISHDHYDHLDHPTIRAMKDWDTTFVVPLGVGAHLEYWGVPAARIVELDWWERTTVRGLEIVATPARHTSGRAPLVGAAATLWSGFALLGRERRVYYSGDTGLFPGLREIGDRLGPFDVTLIEAGEYGRWWPDWHLGPEQAVQAHRLVRGGVLIPAHWGLLTLAYHAWTEPIERVLAAAAGEGVTVAAPRPGESVEPLALPPLVRWWPQLPGRSAQQDPIVSSGVGAGGPGT